MEFFAPTNSRRLVFLSHRRTCVLWPILICSWSRSLRRCVVASVRFYFFTFISCHFVMHTMLCYVMLCFCFSAFQFIFRPLLRLFRLLASPLMLQCLRQHLAYDLNSLCVHGSKQFIELSHIMLSRLSTLLCSAVQSGLVPSGSSCVFV